MAKMTKAEKIAERQAERRIDESYRRTCSGVQINIMDIGKVFAAGREAIVKGANGPELDAAIVAFVETIRCN